MIKVSVECTLSNYYITIYDYISLYYIIRYYNLLTNTI